MSCPGLVSYPFAMGFCQSWETYFSTVITVDVIIQTVGEARRGKVWRLENDCRNPRAILLCDNFPTTHPTTSFIIRSTPLAVHYNVSKIYGVGGSITLGLLSQIEPFFLVCIDSDTNFNRKSGSYQMWVKDDQERFLHLVVIWDPHLTSARWHLSASPASWVM